MIFTVPFPPSTNKIWRSVGGRSILSEKARDYKTDAVADIIDQCAKAGGPPPRYDCRLMFALYLSPPDRRRRDISNFIKLLEDCCVHAGVMVDDKLVDELHVYRCDVVKDGKAIVVVEPCPEPSQQMLDGLAWLGVSK